MHQSHQRSWLRRWVAPFLLATSRLATAYDLDPESTESVKSIAKQMAGDLVSFYKGDQPGGTPGLLPAPYYWWETGAMMGALVDYWYYTKDDAYVDLTKEALLFQVGETNDYMPRNQTLTEGNDDQGFWALAVMSAAEYNFPNPEPDQPQWLALAQAVFNTQAARWDTEHCNGGLRWQIFTWNRGFDYKNSISQACFFALGARLAVYTGNSSYAEWAERTWDWMMAVEFIDPKSWYVFDGAPIQQNCTAIVPFQFSYNAAGFILGAAAMYNFTEEQRWKDRLDNLLTGSKVFFTGPKKNIMTEVACEPVNLCNLDQQSFKAYLSRWLAAITKWAPHTYDFVIPYLRASAVAAAKQCVGGKNGRMCGLVWNKDKYDGTSGVGQQMAALEVTLSCMIKDRDGPLTSDNGGTSKGNPGSGGDDIGRTSPRGPAFRTITAGDKAGAAMVTMIILLTLVGGIFCMLLDEVSDKSVVEQIKGFRSSATASIAALVGVSTAAARGERQREYKEKSRYGLGKAPMEAVRVRNIHSEGQHPRRRSSMPLGWPHNASIRSSVVLDVATSQQLASQDYSYTEKESQSNEDRRRSIGRSRSDCLDNNGHGREYKRSSRHETG